MQVAGSGGVGGVSPSRVVERSASGLRIVRSLPDGTALLHSASQSAPGLPKPRPIELSCKSISLSCAIALGLEFSCAVPNMCSMPIGWARRDAHCPHTLEPGPRPDAQGHHPQLHDSPTSGRRLSTEQACPFCFPTERAERSQSPNSNVQSRT